MIRSITGVLFVLVGLIWLLVNVFHLSLGAPLWPMILVLGGLIFLGAYAYEGGPRRGYEALLIPGIYLVVIGLLFLVLAIVGWEKMAYLWPTFILGVALALGGVYLSVPPEALPRRKSLMRAIQILLLISAFCYLLAIKASIVWPLALIALGFLIIFRAFGH